jgi:hypothetical protein
LKSYNLQYSSQTKAAKNKNIWTGSQIVRDQGLQSPRKEAYTLYAALTRGEA